MARILAPTPENIALAAQAILRNEVVGMPTETVYGLAGNALSQEALAKIFTTKDRPAFDPLILHVAGQEDLALLNLVDFGKLTAPARTRVQVLVKRFWPGPLTLVLPKTEAVPDLATSGLDTVAVRMPRHPVAQALIRCCGVSLAAPSANRFGRISPTSAEDVREELGERIPLVLDGGRSEIGLESTVVRVFEDGELILLRPGAISALDLEEATGQRPRSAPEMDQRIHAPGMLDSHYAPTKPLILLPKTFHEMSELELRSWWESKKEEQPKHTSILLMQGNAEAVQKKMEILTHVPCDGFSLSQKGDWKEASFHFFSCLRAMDRSQAELLIAEPCLETQGLGYAISDRLRRASWKKE